MITEEVYKRVLTTFPILDRADTQTISLFQQSTCFLNLPAPRTIYRDGNHVSALPLILSGSVRVFVTGKTGRELTLYRFGAGDSCTLTASAILKCQPFPANAVAEQMVEAVMIPEDVLRLWVQQNAFWREMIIDLFSEHISTVLSLVEELVFRRMDARVASFLEKRNRLKNPVSITHHEIAAELGSSREVISRILERFESNGIIQSMRGTIDILDLDSLISIARG